MHPQRGGMSWSRLTCPSTSSCLDGCGGLWLFFFFFFVLMHGTMVLKKKNCPTQKTTISPWWWCDMRSKWLVCETDRMLIWTTSIIRTYLHFCYPFIFSIKRTICNLHYLVQWVWTKVALNLKSPLFLMIGIIHLINCSQVEHSILKLVAGRINLKQPLMIPFFSQIITQKKKGGHLMFRSIYPHQNLKLYLLHLLQNNEEDLRLYHLVEE